MDCMINSITLLLNHGLNCGCLLGDTGCVSTILWTFEDREQGLLLYVDLFGSRMHVNSSWSTSSRVHHILHVHDMVHYNTTSLLGLLELRTSYSRLAGTYVLPARSSLHDSYSGPLLFTSGISLSCISCSGLSSQAITGNVLSGTRSDSLVRIATRLSMVTGSMSWEHTYMVSMSWYAFFMFLLLVACHLYMSICYKSQVYIICVLPETNRISGQAHILVAVFLHGPYNICSLLFTW